MAKNKRANSVYVGKQIKAIEIDYLTMVIEFTDGSKMHVEADGYQGTKLLVRGEYLTSENFHDD